MALLRYLIPSSGTRLILAAAATAGLLTACQTPSDSAGVGFGSGASGSGSVGANLLSGGETAASRARPYYVKVQPEATSLQAVNDDGENTFVEFGILPPGELKFFDAEGRPLRAVWVRNMAVVPGTFQGILIRLGTATSYISLNPQSDRMRKPPLPEIAIISELRDRLLQEGQRGAMERAAAKAAKIEQSSAEKSLIDVKPVSGTNSVKPVTEADRPPPAQVVISTSPANAIPAGASPAQVRPVVETQLAENMLAREAMERALDRTQSRDRTDARGEGKADTKADPAWPRTQRVYFATNSVGISAPDDGLHRLMIDARQSDEIWISGHTDNKGTRSSNEYMAKRRAEAIKHILTSRGIAPERIVIVRAPVDTYIAGNETEVGRSQNRRVEVTFMRARGAAAASVADSPAPRAGVGNNLAR